MHRFSITHSLAKRYSRKMTPIMRMLALGLGLASVAEGWYDETVKDHTHRKNYVVSEQSRLQLVEQDFELAANLNAYAEELQKKISVLRRVAENWRRALDEAKGREEEYLSSPLHSFPLIRTLHEDWGPVERLMQQLVGQEQIAALELMREHLPGADDVAEAMWGIFRIVHTHNLEPKDVAEGVLDGIQYRGRLSALDCQALGKFYFHVADYQTAIKWLTLSQDLMEEQPLEYYEELGATSSGITLLLARCLVALDRIDEAQILLRGDKTFGDRAYHIVSHFQEHPPQQSINIGSRAFTEKFNRLCSSMSRRKTDGSAAHSKPSRLHCRYNATTTAFLRLAPLRMEELSLDPYIVLYHNVLSDEEMAKLENMSTPLLHRARVFDKETKKPKISPVRSADEVGIPNPKLVTEDIQLVECIQKRMTDLTGLVLASMRRIQFLKYGFGGIYVPHHDFFSVHTETSRLHGDRIATVIFYLNDVEHGGATAFPNLDLVVPTERGAVLFWHNMDGETYDLDYRTLHGACPVIVGTKMVMARWIYEWDQMFVKSTYHPPRQKDYRQFN
ncbi:prolyl 4-hydroxylase subunit alpha-1-like [Drosophila miranda]|uniref:prolyl 4-hydroxylase subunit alpha-1-like n=1 Tax=Drosophila miranda TaxID=7229 RepID=UPI00143F5BD3|nr:prolyl 4-hydroxylase subunit alpha-1-like [Drosophila miranda]